MIDKCFGPVSANRECVFIKIYNTMATSVVKEVQVQKIGTNLYQMMTIFYKLVVDQMLSFGDAYWVTVSIFGHRGLETF